MRELLALFCVLFSLPLLQAQDNRSGMPPLGSEVTLLGDSLILREADSLSLYYEGIGYYDRALIELDRLSDLNISQWRRKANLHFRLDDYDKAKEVLLDHLLPIDTIYADLNLLATIFYQSKDIFNALNYRKLIADRYPFNGANLILLSTLYQEVDRLEDVMGYLDAYISEYPDRKPVLRQRALNRYKLGMKEESLQDFARLYAMGDDNPNSLYYYASLLIDSDSIPKAGEVLAIGAEVTNYENPILLLDYAYVLEKQKEYDHSLSMLEHVDSLLNKTPEVLYNNFRVNELTGKVLSVQKKFNRAGKAYTKALEFNPDSEIILYNLIMIENALNHPITRNKWIDRYLNLIARLPHDQVDHGMEARISSVKLLQSKAREEVFMNR